MWIPLGLFMKEHFQFSRFGWTLKVCIVFIVLTSTTSLACRGGGSKKEVYKKDDWEKFLNHTENMTLIVPELDEKFIVNLTGIKGQLARNALTAFGGWEPSEETKKEWEKFYENWQAENEKNGEVPWNKKNKKKGKGGPGGVGSDGPGGGGSGGPGGDGSGRPGWQDFSHERGPGSGWPNSPGWEDLGVGNGGSPIPPWAYVPKNVGKPSICYLPPVKGTCRKDIGGQDMKPVQRWGYNPYTDECQAYEWSGCGGTRNKFISKEKCVQHCQLPPPPSCSADSGILDKSPKS